MTAQRYDSPIDDWTLLDETRLPNGSNTTMLIRSWLRQLLSPLNLNEDFLNKILRSAEEYVGRARLHNAGIGCDHIHLSIFVIYEHLSTANTWGFYRIEKIDGTHHTVEFYLYVDGQ